VFDDIYYQARLNDISHRQSDLKSESTSLDYEVKQLRRLISKMALANQALYELLKTQTGITDEELRLKIREIDKRDGVEDGNLNAKPLLCPKCGTTVTAGSIKCHQCEATIAPRYPFEP
jgi:predicted Zn-ribbon and HTH transcriptional regulator